MSDRICGLLGQEEGYLRRLAGAINGSEELFFRVMTFTDREALENYLETHSMELLIVDGAYYDDRVAYKNIAKLLYLTEEKPAGSEQIYKYQSAEDIIRDIGKAINAGRSNAGRLRCYGVYSPVGGCGKTIFSLALAKSLGRNHRVLYVNFQEFAGLGGMLPKVSGNLSDCVYQYITEAEALKSILEDVIVKGTYFDYIPEVECAGDISYTGELDWMKMVESLGQWGGYDYVVTDVGQVVKAPWQFLQLCDRVYMPNREDRMAELKMEAFNDYIRKLGKETLLEKITYVKLRNEDLNTDGILDNLEGTYVWKQAESVMYE